MVTTSEWQAVDAGNGAIYLQSVHSAVSASRSRAPPPRTAPSSSSTPGNNATNQKFTATQTTTSGIYTIKSVLSGLCVDVNGASQADGARLLQWTCQGSTNQQWAFTLA